MIEDSEEDAQLLAPELRRGDYQLEFFGAIERFCGAALLRGHRR
jgi:hypothetical protein